MDCSATSNDGLVDNLKAHGLLTSAEVESVLRQVDRAHFIPLLASPSFSPYADCPQPIGALATISAPHSHCLSLQLLYTHTRSSPPPTRILDLGSGSGYLTVCLALLFPSATVIGVDHSPHLTSLATSTTTLHHPDLLSPTPTTPHPRLTFLTSNAMLGLPSHEPYDIIHVGAACDSMLARRLLFQVKVGGGVMLVPEVVRGKGGGRQKLRLHRRMAQRGSVMEEVMEVSYARMQPEPPPADVDRVDRWEEEGERLWVEVEELKRQVKGWHDTFKHKHKRLPGEADRRGDEQLRGWLAAFHEKTGELERRRRVRERMEGEKKGGKGEVR